MVLGVRASSATRCLALAVSVWAAAASVSDLDVCEHCDREAAEDAEGLSLRQLRARPAAALEGGGPLELQVEHAGVVPGLRLIAGPRGAVERLRAEALVLAGGADGALDCKQAQTLPMLRLALGSGHIFELRADEYVMEAEGRCALALVAAEEVPEGGRWLIGDFGHSEAMLLEAEPTVSPPPSGGQWQWGQQPDWTAISAKMREYRESFKEKLSNAPEQFKQAPQKAQEAWKSMMDKLKGTSEDMRSAAAMDSRCNTCTADLGSQAQAGGAADGCSAACATTQFPQLCSHGCSNLKGQMCHGSGDGKACASKVCHLLMMCKPSMPSMPSMPGFPGKPSASPAAGAAASR